MFRVLAHLALNVITVLIIREIFPNEIFYDTNEALVIFAVVLGLLNAVVLPILNLIALPLTCLTLGLFTFVLSAAVFYLAGVLVPGIEITILGAVIGAVLLGILGSVMDTVLRGR